MRTFEITGQYIVSVPFTITVHAPTEHAARDYVAQQGFDLDIAAPHNVSETVIETVKAYDLKG